MLLHAFTSNRKEVTADDDILDLVLGQNIIKCVKETKFLGVIINDKLSWDAHIKYLNSKLKREIGKLNRMKHVIPNDSLLIGILFINETGY